MHFYLPFIQILVWINLLNGFFLSKIVLALYFHFIAYFSDRVRACSENILACCCALLEVS